LLGTGRVVHTQIGRTDAEFRFGCGRGTATEDGASAVLFKTFAMMRRAASGTKNGLRFVWLDRAATIRTDSGAHGGREESRLGCSAKLNQFEAREQECNHDGGKHFEEAFNPEMKYPTDNACKT
jgi:hypothetical protein